MIADVFVERWIIPSKLHYHYKHAGASSTIKIIIITILVLHSSVFTVGIAIIIYNRV